MADGLRTTAIGSRNFAVISGRVERIVAVTEAEILDAMRFVWERIKIVIEPSSAVAVAPLLTGSLDTSGLRVGVLISGGNVDTEPLIAALASKYL
jgi:threonine dehydratase